MISVNNLSLYFGGQDVFSNISFMINKGDKIGLVGKMVQENQHYLIYYQKIYLQTVVVFLFRMDWLLVI